MAAASTAPLQAMQLPTVPAGLRAGNARAAGIARASRFISTQHAAALALARSIRNAALRKSVLDVIAHPEPRYARKYATALQREQLRDALAAAGFAQASDPVSGIFPPGTESDAIVQPFWSAPGSAYDSHHSYPGGLAVHELFNASIAADFAAMYRHIYFPSQAKTPDRDLVIAAAFYHDVMKTVVFQFNDDGTLLPELTIAGTGGHHCLSGAEAIVRGHDAKFVTVLLSAHAAPSLGDEAKVVSWCRAAAMIAGVDPVEYGLIAKDGTSWRLAQVAPVEAFISNLSDHDYVLSVHAMQQVAPRLEAMHSDRWWRHRVLSNVSAIALYEALARGERAFAAAVDRAAADERRR